jgi:hypothetical protein
MRERNRKGWDGGLKEAGIWIYMYIFFSFSRRKQPREKIRG